MNETQTIDPRVRIPREQGRQRHSNEVLAYTRAVQEMTLEIHDRLDALGIPREIDTGRLTLGGRVKLLLDTYEFEVER